MRILALSDGLLLLLLFLPVMPEVIFHTVGIGVASVTACGVASVCEVAGAVSKALEISRSCTSVE